MTIKHLKSKLLWLTAGLPMMAAAQTLTLDACQQQAADHYPLTRRYGLIAGTTAVALEDIGTAWLPQVNAYAQATIQDKVVELPDALTATMRQGGLSMEGLNRSQYKVGVDVSQTLYDGGSIARSREMARRQGDVATAQNEVSLYAVRKRVNELYFGVLLTDELLRLNTDRCELLRANERQVESMLKGGIAMECDYHALKAERLTAEQAATELKSQRQQLLRQLAILTGTAVEAVVRPPMIEPETTGCNRPELRLADARLLLTDAEEKALQSGLLPRVNIFASGYYGYPGYNMYGDMLRHRPSLNGMVGIRISWNISGLYTRKTDKARLQLQRASAENERETFLLNNRIEQLAEEEETARYRQLLDADDAIIELRGKVRRSYESKLRHGIIETTSLLQEINKENGARTARSTHEVQLLKSLYDRKYTMGQ